MAARLRVKELAEARGLTTPTLLEKASGVDSSRLAGYWHNTISNLHFATLQRLADALNVAVGQLFDDMPWPYSDAPLIYAEPQFDPQTPLHSHGSIHTTGTNGPAKPSDHKASPRTRKPDQSSTGSSTTRKQSTPRTPLRSS